MWKAHQERWRDWPYEARQPFYAVPIPTGRKFNGISRLRDERKKFQNSD
jgi:hypothetical protein